MLATHSARSHGSRSAALRAVVARPVSWGAARTMPSTVRDVEPAPQTPHAAALGPPTRSRLRQLAPRALGKRPDRRARSRGGASRPAVVAAHGAKHRLRRLRLAAPPAGSSVRAGQTAETPPPARTSARREKQTTTKTKASDQSFLFVRPLRALRAPRKKARHAPQISRHTIGPRSEK